MYEAHRSKAAKQRSGRTNLASCIVAGVFLLLIGVAVVVVYFLLFKPKQPEIAVNAVQFPSLSVSNKTVNFTFFQLVTVTNPNRDTFTHYDSSLQLGYSGSPVGFVFIPAGSIDGGRSQHMSAKFSVQDFPFRAEEDREAMEIETEMKLVGRVRVLKVFTHRVETQVKCRVGVHLNDASVLGFHC